MLKPNFSILCSKTQVQILKPLTWTSSTKSKIFFQITRQLTIGRDRFQHPILGQNIHKHLMLRQERYKHPILGDHAQSPHFEAEYTPHSEAGQIPHFGAGHAQTPHFEAE